MGRRSNRSTSERIRASDSCGRGEEHTDTRGYGLKVSEFSRRVSRGAEEVDYLGPGREEFELRKEYLRKRESSRRPGRRYRGGEPRDDDFKRRRLSEMKADADSYEREREDRYQRRRYREDERERVEKNMRRGHHGVGNCEERGFGSHAGEPEFRRELTRNLLNEASLETRVLSRKHHSRHSRDT